MGNAVGVALSAEDLDELDRAILDYLKEGRDECGPWGMATPIVARTALEHRGVDVPVRQTVNNRMTRLALAGHLENRFDKGVYVFVSDPREDCDE